MSTLVPEDDLPDTMKSDILQNQPQQTASQSVAQQIGEAVPEDDLPVSIGQQTQKMGPPLTVEISGVSPAIPVPTKNTPQQEEYTPSTLEEALAEQGMARSVLPNLIGGAIRGSGSIGSTLLAPFDVLSGKIAGKGWTLESNKQRRASIDDGLNSLIGAEKENPFYQGGKLGAEIAGTLPIGGAAGNVVTKAAPSLARIGISPQITGAVANALSTGGFKAGTGINPIVNTAIRAGGGAAVGGMQAGLINPEDAPSGAMIGGALPVATQLLGKGARYVGGGINSLVQPFTTKGQSAIADKIINKFAEGGPTAINIKALVPGSSPTLAEATGNAGIATLQRGARDIRPNAFQAREAANAQARLSALDGIAGDEGMLNFYKASRSAAADDLYGAAASVDASENLTPYVKGQITQLMKRPSIIEASKRASVLALERGGKPAAQGSIAAMQDMKVSIEDMISEAVRAGKGGEAKALQATKEKLLGVMEILSPKMAEARTTYAAMSQPINQMEVLQGLKLTDAQGNITLSKVKNAIDGINRARNAPGVHPAKALEDSQLSVLQGIHGDLLRQSNLSAGKSIGSNTFQNIATDNILQSIIPGRLGSFAQGKIGGLLGQAGRLLYSGPNEAIRNRLVDVFLEPALLNAGKPAQGLLGVSPYEQIYRPLYQTAPYLGVSR